MTLNCPVPSGNIYIQSSPSEKHLIKDPICTFEPDGKGTFESLRTKRLRQGVFLYMHCPHVPTHICVAAPRLGQPAFWPVIFFFLVGNLDIIVCRLRAAGESNVHVDLGQFLFVFVSW